MSERWPGGLISKTPVTPTGPAYNGTAPGIWTIDQMNYWKKQGLWPDPAIVPDPYWSYVSYLLGTTATNAQQNNTFLDSSTNNFTITRVGNTTQGSATPYGTLWSNYFDGSGDYLSAPTNAGYDVSGGDYTIEAWINISALPAVNNSGNRVACIAIYSSGLGGGFELDVDLTQNIVIMNQPGSASATYGSYTFAIGQWYHVAFCRASGTNRIFVNGTALTLTGNTFPNNATGSAQLRIGAALFAGGYDHYLPGYISNFRIVKGTGLYSSNFTPSSTPLTAVSGTSILTAQSNRFKDNSTNNATVTGAGDTKVTAFSPFILAYPGYTTAANGGSGYFNGSTDYLSLAGASAFSIATSSTPFTIETWIYPTAAGGCIFSEQWTGSGNVAISLIMNAASGLETNGQYVTLGYYNGAWATTRPTTPVPLNAWTHVAAVFTGSTSAIYYNGVNVTAASPITSWATAGNAGDGWYIGKRWDTPGGYVNFFSGYMAGFRFTNGTAVYTSAFTPPTTPPTAITNTALLCNFTNAGLYDAAVQNNMETVGNAQVSNAQAKYGTTSAYFDGSGDYLTLKPGAGFAFGTGSFTVETWVYPTNASGTSYNIIDARNSGQTGTWVLYRPSSNLLEWYNGSSAYTASVNIPSNQWSHVSYCRSGTTGRLFLNGTVVGTFTDSTNYSVAPTTSYIASRYTANEFLNGYIDDLRITKGVARYTASFTPPTAALPVY